MLNDICDCCGGSESQEILQLFDGKYFGIVDGKNVNEKFAGLNLESSGGTHEIFNNNLPVPLLTLQSGKAYARGILLKITYPTNDSNSEEVLISDKNVTLTIETFDGISTDYPLYNFFAIFSNPKSNDPSKVINKIEITNLNTDYAIRISALILFGNAL
jgi:hypothetical protein